MQEKEIKIIEQGMIVAISVWISMILCDMFGLSKFYAGIAALNVINLNDARTRRQAYERTVTTFLGGLVACGIAYSGFQQNMLLYVIGLGIVCCITEFVIHVPATVGCIAFTYIMLNIDPGRTPTLYLEERVLGTAAGALIVSVLVTAYSRLKHKPKETFERITEKDIIHHIKRGVIPGIAVILGYLIVSYLNKHMSSKYVTNYTLYYCALASVVPFHVDMKELLHKSKERVISTIAGGIIAFFFVILNLKGIFWTGCGILVVIFIIETFIKVSASLGGIVFLFIMVNMTEEITPLVYYVDRVLGTIIGVLLIISVSYMIGKLKNYILVQRGL